jgi:Uma2 family endonuclease
MNVLTPTAPEQAATEQRFLLQAVNWQFYETLLNALGDRPVRLTYDRGNLELMSPSFEHETYAYLLGRFLDILTLELKIPMKACRSTTFRRQDLDRGLEPDNCYYLRHAAQLRGRREIELTRDPPPDLAIEIDITRSSLDRMGIYAALGVPELWRFDGEALQAYRLGAGGGYEPSAQSLAFPFLPLAEVVPFLHQGLTAADDTGVAEAFLAWVRQRILPGLQGQQAATPKQTK